MVSEPTSTWLSRPVQHVTTNPQLGIVDAAGSTSPRMMAARIWKPTENCHKLGPPSPTRKYKRRPLALRQTHLCKLITTTTISLSHTHTHTASGCTLGH
jgi:hypothetical protein